MDALPHARLARNAPGDWYTTGECMACGAPETQAPELLWPLADGDLDTYFVRQPATPTEVEHACRAAEACCVTALRYGGCDPAIIRRLGNSGEYCDFAEAPPARCRHGWSPTCDRHAHPRLAIPSSPMAGLSPPDTPDPQDADLDALSAAELRAEVRRLRAGIRAHRDSSGHALCWHHPALWGLLPERTDPQPVVPDWPQFLEGCIQYRRSLDAQLPRAPRAPLPPPRAGHDGAS